MQTTKRDRSCWSLRPNVLARLVFWMLLVNLYFLFALFLAASEADGHEFEDGFVERSVAVVVRNNVARLEYSIGLNPSTRQQLINFWQSTDGREGETQNSREKKSGSQQQTVDFLQLAADHLSRRLDIVVDNQPVEHKLISALRSSRHHVDVTVILEFNLSNVAAQIPIAIEITDGNFFPEAKVPKESSPSTGSSYSNVLKPKKTARTAPAPFAGGFRYAFKTAGSTVLNRSNVASILIRADRHLDDNFSDEQLVTAFKIKAKVAYIHGSPPKQ